MPLANIVIAAASSLLALLVAALAAFLTHRSAAPSDAEVFAAEKLAQDSWNLNETPQLAAVSNQRSGDLDSDSRASEILRQYAEDLRIEATRIAKRSGAESPSAIHIQLAAARIGILRQRASALADIGLTVGSILFGGSASYGINLATGGTAESGSEPWAIAIGAAGLVILATSSTAKWIRR